MNEKELKSEIIEELAVLSEHENGLKKKLCLVKWGDKEPVYDVRVWNSKGAPYKGVVLNQSEMSALKDALMQLGQETEKSEAKTANVMSSPI